MIVSIDWRSPAVTILPVFYKQMLQKLQVVLQEGVSKVKCYAYRGNRVLYIMVTIVSLVFLLFHPIHISLGMLVSSSRDRQGKLWLLNVFGKQPYNNMSFKYRP